jgi:hypothetical protein
VRFFLDNCISKAMARAIGALAAAQGHEVVHLTDRFDAATPDAVWIPQIREDGFIIVSGDPRITRNPANREAWHESGLTAFFLGDGFSDRRFWVQAEEIVRWFPRIVDAVKTCTPGSGFLLPFKGSEPKLIYKPLDDR